MKKKINILDLLILLTIIFSITGFSLVKAEKSSLNKIIEGKKIIGIKVFLNDVNYEKDDLLKAEDLTAITIRNKPYKKLKIISVSSKEKIAIIPMTNGNFKLVEDPNKENIKDLTVTVTDTALITKDGFAIDGNKIKIGNHIELEGFKYRLMGIVVDIFPINNHAK